MNKYMGEEEEEEEEEKEEKKRVSCTSLTRSIFLFPLGFLFSDDSKTLLLNAVTVPTNLSHPF